MRVVLKERTGERYALKDFLVLEVIMEGNVCRRELEGKRMEAWNGSPVIGLD